MKRSKQKEFIDLGPAFYTKEEYDSCLIQLSRIGKFLGGDRATFKNIKEKPKTILEVGCGGGLFALKMGRKFPEAKVVGIDISKEAIVFARRELFKSGLKNVHFEMQKEPRLDFEANSFDLITTTLVCHHMQDDEIVEFLKSAYRVAKKSIVINDLHRSWLAYGAFALISGPLFSNRLIFHDGLLSIKRSFTKADWLYYLKAAGIPLEKCKISWHFAFRWVVKVSK